MIRSKRSGNNLKHVFIIFFAKVKVLIEWLVHSGRRFFQLLLCRVPRVETVEKKIIYTYQKNVLCLKSFYLQRLSFFASMTISKAKQSVKQINLHYIIKMGAILIPYFLEQWPFFNVYTDNEILYNLIF